MAALNVEKVNFSAIDGEVLAQIHDGVVFEVVRNKRPDGIFMMRRPQSEQEVEEFAEMLRLAMREKKPV